jgi:hypothetical protein
MTYSRAKMKSSGDKASPSFRPFWIGKISDKCLPILSNFVVSSDSVRELYNTSFLTFLTSMNN